MIDQQELRSVKPSDNLSSELAALMRVRADVLISTINEKRVLAAIYLDKSAREFQYILRRRWHESQTSQIPAQVFVNSGREKVALLFEYMEKMYDLRPQNPNLRKIQKHLNVFSAVHTYKLDLLDSSSNLKDLVTKEQFSSFCNNVVTKEALVQIYGAKNVSNLQNFLLTLPKGQRIMIDDLQDTGWGLLLTQHIFKTLDPDNKYTPFMIIEETDIDALRGNKYMPWTTLGSKDQSSYQVVMDSADRASFVSARVPTSQYKKGLQQRAE